MKSCAKCKEAKDDSEFYKTKTKSGRSPYCKSCHRENQSQWDNDNRAKKLEFNRNWRYRNPERRKLLNKASQIVFKAIKSGGLVRPYQCSKCSSKQYIEAAHSDYSRPLDVIWLCRKCHRSWDAEKPKSDISYRLAFV